jgi:acyl dehydratase
VTDGARVPASTDIAGARHLDDYRVGDRSRSGEIAVSADDIIAFARQYDPQPFHLDPEAAKTSLFGGHVASGWHMTALAMRLIVDSDLKPAGGVIGRGVDELRWPNPLRPGDRVHVRAEVLEIIPSTSKPDRGTLRVRTEMVNQKDQVVMSFIALLVVPRRLP